MATARISQAAPPNVDPTKATIAFGDRAVPRLERELQSTDLVTVQKALFALCDMIRNPNHIQASLQNGIVQCLLDLLVHKDDVVRQKTTEALLHFAGHAIGRDAIVSQGLIKALSGLFSDPSAVVRLNVHKTIERTSTAQNAAMQLVRLNLITTLLDALKAERESEIQTFILKTLYNTMKVDTDCLLGNKAMDTFVDLIQSSGDLDIRQSTAHNIMALSFPLEGKKQACACGAIPPIVYLLEGSARPPTATDAAKWFGVVSAAAGALMSITVTTEGKKLAIKAKALDTLPPLLECDDERVMLNGIKLITTLAEDPAGRSQLLPLVPRLTELKDYNGVQLDHMAVSRNAQTAIDTIVWRP